MFDFGITCVNSVTTSLEDDRGHDLDLRAVRWRCGCVTLHTIWHGEQVGTIYGPFCGIAGHNSFALDGIGEIIRASANGEAFFVHADEPQPSAYMAVAEAAYDYVRQDDRETHDEDFCKVCSERQRLHEELERLWPGREIPTSPECPADQRDYAAEERAENDRKRRHQDLGDAQMLLVRRRIDPFLWQWFLAYRGVADV